MRRIFIQLGCIQNCDMYQSLEACHKEVKDMKDTIISIMDYKFIFDRGGYYSASRRKMLKITF